MSRQYCSLEQYYYLKFLTSFTVFSTLFSPPINPVVELTSSFRADSTEDLSDTTQPELPQIFDINLKADIVFQGLDFPTSFAFLGPDDMLVLEKNSGQVRRIVNGSLLPGITYLVLTFQKSPKEEC